MAQHNLCTQVKECICDNFRKTETIFRLTKDSNKKKKHILGIVKCGRDNVWKTDITDVTAVGAPGGQVKAIMSANSNASGEKLTPRNKCRGATIAGS